MTDAMTNPRYVLNVLGQDRPGIVAAVSRAMTDAGCNIEDSSMTMLKGAFAMIMIITVPAGAENPLRTAMVGITATQGLQVHIDPYPEADEGLRRTVEGVSCSLTLHGADHPGIVAAVTEMLASDSINVVDLSTHVVEGSTPVYIMTMELVVPESVDKAGLRGRLDKLSEEIHCAISLTEIETATL